MEATLRLGAAPASPFSTPSPSPVPSPSPTSTSASTSIPASASASTCISALSSSPSPSTSPSSMSTSPSPSPSTPLSQFAPLSRHSAQVNPYRLDAGLHIEYARRSQVLRRHHTAAGTPYGVSGCVLSNSRTNLPNSSCALADTQFTAELRFRTATCTSWDTQRRRFACMETVV